MTPEHLARLVIESLDVAILTTDLDGVITSWNSAAERIMGWSAVEAIGWDFCMIFTPEDVASGTGGREMESVRSGHRAAGRRRYLRQDGSRFWGLNTMLRLHDHRTGEHVGYVTTLRACGRHLQAG